MDPRVSHSLGLVGLTAAVAMAWELHYVPLTRVFFQKRQALANLQQQVGQMNRWIQLVHGQEAWVTRQQEVMTALSQRLPPSRKAPKVLNELLAELARKRLDLTNVSQGNLEPAKEADGSPMVIEGVACFRLPVTLTAVGRFRAIVEYVEQVKHAGFPCVVQLERMDLTATEPGETKLRMSITMFLYFLG